MASELSVRLNGIEVGTLSLINGKMEFLYNDDATSDYMDRSYYTIMDCNNQYDNNFNNVLPTGNILYNNTGNARELFSNNKIAQSANTTNLTGMFSQIIDTYSMNKNEINPYFN